MTIKDRCLLLQVTVGSSFFDSSAVEEEDEDDDGEEEEESDEEGEFENDSESESISDEDSGAVDAPKKPDVANSGEVKKEKPSPKNNSSTILQQCSELFRYLDH